MSGATKDDEAELAAKVEKYRERMAAEVAEIKDTLKRWIKPHDNPGTSVRITTALLDLALDRHVETHEANGFDLIEAAYQRALKRSRGPLQ
jgi:hypothetical protein